MGLGFATWIALAAMGIGAKPGAISVSAAAIDFGDVPRDAVRVRTVELVNRGGTPIALGRTDADCTCLSGVLSEGNLEAGARRTWTITLSTCDYVGEVRRSVWLVHDGNRLCTLPVRYRVVPPIYPEPAFASVGWLAHDDGQGSVEIRSVSGSPARILDVTSSSDDVVACVEQGVITPDAPGTIRVQFIEAGLPPGPIKATVTVHTDSADVPTIRIPVHGESGAPITLAGTAAQFGAVALNSGAKVSIALRGDGEVRGVRCSGDVLEVAEITRRPSEATVRLRVRDREPLGTFQGFVTFDTMAGGESRTLRLPYWGRIVEPTSVPQAVAGHPSPGCSTR